MNKIDFWELTDQTRKTYAEDKAGYLKQIMERLTKAGLQYAQDFHDILHAYMELADKLNLWCATSLSR